jgi:hypothetical protein
MSLAVERYLEVQSGLSRRQRDPLSFWHHASPQSRQATAFISEYDEVYARAANKAGKTEWAAAVTLAILQKRRHLDGVPMPQWKGRLEGLVLTLDYNQQKLSVQPALLRLLGDWPHKCTWKGDGILSSLKIRPLGEERDDPEWWSVIHFMSEENKRAGVGARADLVWADEPPIEEIWRECRKAAHAGRKIVRLISATPINRRQWAWIKEEYGDCPRRGIRQHEDWVEVRWSLDDNAALSKAERDKLKREWRNDPLERGDNKARSHGDYVDASGLCPFDVETLWEMLEETRDPKVERWSVTRPLEGHDLKQILKVPLEVWEKPKEDCKYYITMDLSSGIEDSNHDPSGLLVLKMGTGDLVARSVGYLDSYSRGILAAGVARRYNNAMVDFEVNDGWGVGALRGLHDSKYGNIAKEYRELQPGKWATELGFKTTQKSRAGMIAAIQAWIAAYQQGLRYGKCPSRKLIECLLDCILDETGKPVAAPGLHDEDLIMWGQGLKMAVTNSGIPTKTEAARRMSREEKLVEMIKGHTGEEDTPFGQVYVKPKERIKA